MKHVTAFDFSASTHLERTNRACAAARYNGDLDLTRIHRAFASTAKTKAACEQQKKGQDAS